jgi:hypothetical protein
MESSLDRTLATRIAESLNDLRCHPSYANFEDVSMMIKEQTLFLFRIAQRLNLVIVLVSTRAHTMVFGSKEDASGYVGIAHIADSFDHILRYIPLKASGGEPSRPRRHQPRPQSTLSGRMQFVSKAVFRNERRRKQEHPFPQNFDIQVAFAFLKEYL